MLADDHVDTQAIWCKGPKACWNLRKWAWKARWHVSIKHTRQNDTWGTLVREYVNTQDMLTCEHVSTQGTLTRENILGKQSTQFSRLVKTYTDVNLKEQTFRRASNSLFRKMNIMKLKPIQMCSLDSFPALHGVN